MTDHHTNVLTAEEKLEVLRQLANVKLDCMDSDPEYFQIYIQDRDTPAIRYWARMSFDRDELIVEMYNHYYELMMKHCDVS